MSSVLTLIIVDEKTMGEFYQTVYPSAAAFYQAIHDAMEEYAEDFYEDSIQVMRNSPQSDGSAVIRQFLRGLFSGEQIVGTDQDGVVDVSYMPRRLYEDDISMIGRVLTDYEFNKHQANNFPKTTLEEFLQWLEKNKDKAVHSL